MKTILLSITAVSFLILSCTNGSATSLENQEQSAPVMETAADGQDEASGKTVKLTKQDFLEKVMNYEQNQTEWVYQGDRPALIDFYADWCGPCRAFAPTFEAVAGDLPEYKFVKVDVDSNPGLARHYQINFIPFIVAVKDGKIVAEYKGVRTKEDFTAWVKKVNVQNK